MIIIKIEKADVLIVGSGGAGLRAAIELFDNKVDVLVVGKCKKRKAHTIMATGGINAALGNMDPKDTWQQHAADTIADGGEINDGKAVETLCKNAPHAIKELAKWKCPFNREKNGKISQRFFGAAVYRRACFIKDHTGKAILNTLVDQVVKRKIRFKEEHYVLNLLTKNGKVNGALMLNMRSGKLVVAHAKLVILATGGHSRVYRHSSSHFWENNGDGIWLANELGAKCMDMELFQFHPTGMMWPQDAEGLLVTEAVRGEGGILTNSKGERFMEKYDKERLELSARDIVARAIYMEVKKGRGTRRGGVWLDISHRSFAYIKSRLSKMWYQLHKWDHVDISKEKMEVGPTAHYSMGGLLVDHSTGKTTVPRLYAIGEVTSGVHGGNRLGGNSLAEITVFGRLTGKQVTKDVKKIKKWDALDDKLIEKKVAAFEKIAGNHTGANPITLKSELGKVMWDHCGVSRNGKLLKAGLKKLEAFKKKKLKIIGNDHRMNERLIAALDFRNMIPTCEMILRGALMRKESRAAHYRTDYPKRNDKQWKKNIIVAPKSNGKGFSFSTRPVVKPSAAVQKIITRNMKKSTRLLE